VLFILQVLFRFFSLAFFSFFNFRNHFPSFYSLSKSRFHVSSQQKRAINLYQLRFLVHSSLSFLHEVSTFHSSLSTLCIVQFLHWKVTLLRPIQLLIIILLILLFFVSIFLSFLLLFIFFKFLLYFFHPFNMSNKFLFIFIFSFFIFIFYLNFFSL